MLFANTEAYLEGVRLCLAYTLWTSTVSVVQTRLETSGTYLESKSADITYFDMKSRKQRTEAEHSAERGIGGGELRERAGTDLKY